MEKLNDKNLYCNRSIGRGVELKEPQIKYNNTPEIFAHKILPQNYCLNAENVHNLFIENDPDTSELTLNIINLQEAIERREIIKDLFDKTDLKGNLKFFKAIKHNIGWVGCALSNINLIIEANKKNDD